MMEEGSSIYANRREYDSWVRRAETHVERPDRIAAALCYANDLAAQSVLTNRQAQALVLVGSDLLGLQDAATILDIGKSTLSEHLSTAVEKLHEADFLTRAVFDLNQPLGGLDTNRSQYPEGGDAHKRILDGWQNYAFPLGVADWREVSDDHPVWGRYSVYLEPLAGEQASLVRETYTLTETGVQVDGELSQYNDLVTLIEDAYIEGQFSTLDECVALWKTLMTPAFDDIAPDVPLPSPADVWDGDITLREVQVLIQSGHISKDIAARRLTTDPDASTDVMALDEDAAPEDVPETVLN
jgi:DNA-binding CsgD family transcriptional regulator